MKELKQTDRDYIYDNLIDVQETINDLVDRMGEDEVDEDEIEREEKMEIFCIVVWLVLGIMWTLVVLWIISML